MCVCGGYGFFLFNCFKNFKFNYFPALGWGWLFFYKPNCFSGEADERCHRHQRLPGIARENGSTSLINSMLAPADLYCLFLAHDQLCVDFG